MPTPTDDVPTSPDLKPWIVFLAWMTVCYAAAFVGFEGTSQGLWFWYVSQNPPGWCPPTIAFTPINTVVYFCMGLAVWQAMQEKTDISKTTAVALFFIQLTLGALWPWIFFAWRHAALAANFGYALVIVLVATTILFWKIRPSAGRLMLPMIAWASYLTVVQVALYRLNR